jgi:hypothetical protein
MNERTRPIRSELLAAKIEKILNFEQPHLFDELSADPRFAKTLLHLEHVSKPDNYAGGLSQFTSDFIDSSITAIGTATMVKVGQSKSYRVAEAIAILREMNSDQREELFGDETWLFENAFLYREPDSNRVSIKRWRGSIFAINEEEPVETWTGTRGELDRLLVAKLTPDAARKVCVNTARSALSEYFKRLCELPHLGLLPNDNGNGAPGYFSQVGVALRAFIDKRVASLRTTMAETEVTRLVFRWMTKARAMNESIMIFGNSRFGKTEGVKLRCAMEPGSFRMVKTPSTNSLTDLLRAVALSLGIEVGAQNSVRDLRERIEYVLRFSKLVLCFDEAQFLLPASYSRNTAPARLNWVRRAVMDEGLAAVFICTPQSYLPAKRRFVKATGFPMEQFDERILPTVYLPAELSEDDLLAVARIHFDDLAEDYLSVVVGAALATERNYISDIKKIAVLAKDGAREEGRDRPLLCDIEAAISVVLSTAPARPAAAAPMATMRIATPISAPCNRPAEPVQAAGVSPSAFPKSQRGMKPLMVKT